jgi:hypothetical protein
MDPVDLALILAFDGSASVNYDEFARIAGGCGAALRDDAVAAGLLGGPRRASACAVLLWSSPHDQDVVVGWTRLASGADLDGFARAVRDVPRSVRPGTTGLGAGLLACRALLDALPARATRRVIDVAGDGANNDGPPPGPVRDALAADGVTINGLCVLHDEPRLLAYYRSEVIGGPGCFALTCPDYDAFADAMREKLAQEVA